MKIRISALAILLITFFAANVPSAANKQSQLTLLPGLGDVHHPVSTKNVARVQENLLAAAVMLSGRDEDGEAEESGEVVEALQHAIAAEGVLHYNEPPTWFPSSRLWLGRVLLEQKKAVAAEKVFRSALEKTPRYGPALQGLRESLAVQNRQYEASLVDLQLGEAQAPHSLAPRRRR
jgi:hypothetical protein